MKNTRLRPLILLTCVFAAFLFGLLAGKGLSRSPVQIQSLPAVTAAAETAPESTVPAAPAVPAIINLNAATAEQLQTLPGIGPVLSARIITYREKNGGFTTIGELMNVSGIGEKKLEEIWDLVTIGG